MVMMKRDQRLWDNQRKGNNGGVRVSRQQCIFPLLAKVKALLAFSSLVQQQPASLFLLKYHHLKQRLKRILVFPSYLNKEDEKVNHIEGLLYFVISF
jgi:hypothetical protein